MSNPTTILNCAHCGEDFAAADLVTERVADEDINFCCHGCRGAFLIIRGAGLTNFYQRQDRAAGGNKEAYHSHFDPEYLSRFVVHSTDRARISLIIDGIRCASCIWLIEHLLTEQPGILSARVNFATHRILVDFNEELISPADICSQLAQIGYLPRPYSPGEMQLSVDRERRSLLFRFGTAVFLSMQLMGFSIALYAGYFQGINPQTRFLLQIFAALVTTPVIFYSGFPFLRGAWYCLRNRQPNMDLLIALGALSAYSYSLYALTQGKEVYFDTAAMIITLILAGRLYENSARGKASAGVDRLLKLAPERAQLSKNGEWISVDSQQLQSGDHIRIAAGERFPADGTIIKGATEIDEAAVTGEPLPVVREPGDPVVSGSLNLSGLIEVEITAAAADSFISRVAGMVEQAQVRKAPVQRLADRVATIFVPVVLLIAAATYLSWGGDQNALLHAITVLVVACPCALGLATPTAVMVATGRAAEEGILYRGGDILEAVADLTLVAFDKTGTLTTGKPRVSSINPCRGGEMQLLQLLASAESGSRHPLALGIMDRAKQLDLSVAPPLAAETVPGRGIRAHLTEGPCLAGSLRFLREENIELPQIISESDNSEVHLALNHQYLGWVGLSDQIREEAAGLVGNLKSAGIRTLLLTGDRSGVAAQLTEKLGIEAFHAELTPADKAVILEQLSDQRVMMVGDGINDAPALTAARVGCTLAGSTDIAIESADLILIRPQLDRLLIAMKLSRAGMRIIRQNLFWAFSYNLIALPLAACGQLAPVYGAAAMAFSSICVLTNSLRLKKVKLNHE